MDRNRRTHELPSAAACSHFTRKNTWFRAPASSPKQPHATFVQPLQCILQLQVYIHAAITLRSATTDSKTPCNYAHTTNHALQNTIKEPITHQNERTATAAHTSCPPSPPAATLHGNTHGFVLRLPPQSKPHATSMQPLQCVLQRQVANPHLSTHMATERDNNHAAIPLRSATTDSKTPYNYAHTNASKAASTHRYSVAAKIKGPDNRQEREKIWWRIGVCKKCMSKGGA